MQRDLIRAIDDATEWLEIDGVEAVADGKQDGEDCIVVGCSRPPAKLAGRIPKTFHGYPVVLEEWGPISAQGPE
jgi:hypothetical protein